MYNDKFNVLIQGPLDETSLSNIDCYRKYGRVVVSYWDDREFPAKYANKCIPIEGILPDRNTFHGTENWDTYIYALQSMYNGLLACRRPYTIKVRSDEAFTFLEPLIETFLEDTDKVVCGNIFHKATYGFHMGDHIFVVKTEDLKNAVWLLLEKYRRPEIPEEFQWLADSASAETSLARAILWSKDLVLHCDVFSETFLSVDINLLRPFFVQWRHAAKKWDSTKGDTFDFGDCGATATPPNTYFWNDKEYTEKTDTRSAPYPWNDHPDNKKK